MNKRIVAAITGGVWLAAIGSAVALTYALNRPLEVHHVAQSWPSRDLDVAAPRPVVDEGRMDLAPPVLQMPPMVVFGTAATEPRDRGVAEMQGPGGLIIGPGVVTYPAKVPSKAAAP